MATSLNRDTETASRLTRLVALIVLALLAVATLYAGWIAVANFNRIGV
jgi:hypothetical protein